MGNEGIYGEDAMQKAQEVLNSELQSIISGPGINDIDKWELTCYSNDENYPEGEDTTYLQQMEEAYELVDSVYKAYDYLIQHEIDDERIKALETLKASWSEDNK